MAYQTTHKFPPTGPDRGALIAGTYNGVTNPTLIYDKNGNLLSGAGITIGYMSFNQPSSISEGTNAVGLAYNAFHQRYKMCVPDCTAPTTTANYLVDPMTGVYSEKVVSGSTTTWNDYIAVPGAGIVAVRIKSVGAAGDIEAVSSGPSPLWSNALCTGRNFGAKFFEFACRTS